ncbi:MAG: hypothetical protein HY675_04195 [Chloroflexi bacterium]|nr:hypothetical protein [Chloroflexota bacterium]
MRKTLYDVLLILMITKFFVEFSTSQADTSWLSSVASVALVLFLALGVPRVQEAVRVALSLAALAIFFVDTWYLSGQQIFWVLALIAGVLAAFYWFMRLARRLLHPSS